jgi:hypothetical protein
MRRRTGSSGRGPVELTAGVTIQRVWDQPIPDCGHPRTPNPVKAIAPLQADGSPGVGGENSAKWYPLTR